jgi:exonuclease 3'-5' domain-containing protein 1
MDHTVIDTVDSLVAFIEMVPTEQTATPSLYLDIEGIKLSRDGSISIIQVLISPGNHVYLIDVHVLGAAAFTTPAADGRTLQSILESSQVTKAFFDVRNDSDALFSHFGINLDGIQDIQLMELATRFAKYKKCVNGLARCIENDSGMGNGQRVEWKKVKDAGVKLFAPEHGGSYQVFNARPMTCEIRDYCVQDVLFLPVLWMLYNGRLSQTWRNKVDLAIVARVKDSQSATYQPNGRHKALSPWL